MGVFRSIFFICSMPRIESIRRVHNEDIKDIVIVEKYLITVGRDRTVRVCLKKSLEKLFMSQDIGCFANSICAIENTLYVGAQNGKIWVFLLDTQTGSLGVVKVINAHTGNVCCLRARKGKVVSASWDGHVCIIRDGSIVERIKTNKTIWAVDILEDEKETLITSNTDGSIVLYTQSNGGYRAEREISVHVSCVRDILIQPDRFISLSNSGVVIASENTGKIIGKKDLDSISFRVAYCKERGDRGEYAVFSDEGVVHVLDHELNTLYALNLPVLSCWCGILTADSILVGGSDGRIYRFGEIGTEEGEKDLRRIQDEVISQKEEQKAQESKKEKKESKYKVENGKVYEKKGDTWELFGDQIQPEKKDHTVDIELGNKKFKLSFNKGEDHTEVANRFVNEHSLGKEYVEEIVEFLDKNFKQQKKKNLSQYKIYDTIMLDAVKKRISALKDSNIVIDFIESLYNGSITLGTTLFREQLVNVEVVLNGWIKEKVDLLPILDCYKYLIGKGAAVDLIFLQNINVLDNRKDALVYSMIATNILAVHPEKRSYILSTMKKIMDKGLATEEIIQGYKKNLYLAEHQ